MIATEDAPAPPAPPAPLNLQSLTASSELMLNQVPGTLVASQKSISVTATAQQEPMLFAADSVGKFTLTLPDVASTTGWSQVDLTQQLSASSGTSQVVQAFTTAQDDDGGVWIVLATAPSLSAPSQVYLSPKLPNTGAVSDWSSFGANLVARPLPSGTVVGDFLLGRDDDGLGAPLIIAVGGKDANNLIHYQINPNPSDSSWTYQPLLLPQNATALLDAAIGSISGMGRGVYTLSALKNELALTFTTLPQIFNGHVVTKSRQLQLPSGLAPKTITTLAVGQGQTELYVAGNGLYRYNLAAQAESNMLGNYIATGVQAPNLVELLVTTDEAAAAVDVWALNASQQLIHLTGTQTGNDYAWLTPLMVQSEISALTAYRAGHSSSSLAQSGLAVGKTDGSLNVLTQDPSNSLWQPQSVSTYVAESCLEMYTYTSRVTLLDSDGVPWADQPVTVQPSADCAATMNGQYYALKSSGAKVANTDSDGVLSIVLETADLAAPVYSFSSNGLTLSHNPASLVSQTLQGQSGNGITSEEIQKAQRSDDKPLFPNGIDQGKADAASQLVGKLVTVQQAMPDDGSIHPNTMKPHLLKGHAGTRIVQSFGVHFHKDGPRILKTTEEALAYRANSSSDDGGFWVAAGDLFNAIGNALGDVGSFFVDKIEQGWAFVVEIGGQFVQFLFDAAAQVSSAFNYVLQKTLDLVLNDLVGWLGFLFGWSDILANQKALANVVNCGLSNAADTIGNTRTTLTNAFTTVRNLITSNQLLIDKSNAMFADKARSEQSPDDKSSESPQSSWATQQLKNNSKNGNQGGIEIGDISSLFTNLAENQVEILQNMVESIQETIMDNFDTMSWGDILTTVLEIAGLTLLDTAENCVLTFIDAAEILINIFKAILNARIQLPVLTWMFEEVICGGDGTQFTILNAITLLATIPATILFKAIRSENLFTDAQAVDLKNAPNYAAIMTILSSNDYESHASRLVEGLIPSRHLGGPKLTSPAPWRSPQVRAGCVFSCVASFTRLCAAVCYAGREILDSSQLFAVPRDIFNQCKVGFDWCTYIFTLINTSCALSVSKNPSSARVVIDTTVSTMQILINIRDTYTAAYRAQAAHPHVNPPILPALKVVESCMGVGMIVAVSVAFSYEVKENVPDQVDEDEWKGIISTKFVVNMTTSLYRTGSAATLMAGNVKLTAQIVRGVLLGIRALAGIARAGLETDAAWSDT